MMKILLLTFALSANMSWAQPVLRANNPVVNGGSYSTGIAQGSIFVVIGTNLAGVAIVQNDVLPLMTSLGGASIRFTPVNGGGAVDALMVYTTQNQIAALLPSTAALGDYNVTVSYNGKTSASSLATVVARNLGIVSADSSGAGQAQAQVFRTATDFDLNRYATGKLAQFTVAPAHPGQAIVLWGTGIGADLSSDLNGGISGDRKDTASVRIVIGAKEIAPQYAGRASGLPGADQVNFTLPADVDQGCFVPVRVRFGDAFSNLVTMAIAPANETFCQNSSFEEATLKKVSEGGSLTLGSFILSKTKLSITLPQLGTRDITSEGVAGGFTQYSAGNLGNFGNGSDSATGTCQISHSVGDPLQANTASLTYLDAGSKLMLNGPNVANTAVPRQPDNSYLELLGSATPPPFGLTLPDVLTSGTYTLLGTGGTEVGSFRASLDFPVPINWSNRAAITTVDRSQPLVVNWTGGGSGLVGITGSSATVRAGESAANPLFDTNTFVCLADSKAGTFTVPVSILSQLPATTGNILDLTSIGLLGIQQVSDGTQGRFNAPLIKGGNIDRGQFFFTVADFNSVSFK